MPELPEVETIARELQDSSLIGASISHARFFWPKTLATGSEETFNQTVATQKLKSVSRRGKYIFLQLTTYALLIHLRMTGKLAIIPANTPIDPHERVRLYFSSQEALQFIDTRKFGRWYLHAKPEEQLGTLGIEPLSDEFTVSTLKNLLKKSSTRIKPFLLNQTKIAGIGNIYADEALWEAKIHPETPANKIAESKIKPLHKAIRNVLSQGIENMGTRLGSGRANYYSVRRKAANQDKLKVFRRDGLACPRCCTTIVREVIAQRSTHFCPVCQQLNA